MDIKNTPQSLGTVHTEFGIRVIFSSCGGLWHLLLLCSPFWETHGFNNARGSASVVISTLGAGRGMVPSRELQGVPLKDWDNCDSLSALCDHILFYVITEHNRNGPKTLLHQSFCIWHSPASSAEDFLHTIGKAARTFKGLNQCHWFEIWGASAERGSNLTQ